MADLVVGAVADRLARAHAARGCAGSTLPAPAFGVPLGPAQPQQRGEHAGQAAVERARRERRHRQRLDLAVERAVVVLERLVVRQVARPRPVVDRDRPGPGAARPTRLVAWMYSLVLFGWPATTIAPSRGTSTPTEIMFVASSTSIDGASSARALVLR